VKSAKGAALRAIAEDGRGVFNDDPYDKYSSESAEQIEAARARLAVELARHDTIDVGSAVRDAALAEAALRPRSGRLYLIPGEQLDKRMEGQVVTMKIKVRVKLPRSGRLTCKRWPAIRS